MSLRSLPLRVTEVCRSGRAIVDAEIEKLSETVKSQVVNLVAMDKRPFTLNRTAYIQLAQIHLSELRRQRSADPACTCTGAVSTPQWTFPADQSTQAEHPESTWTRHVNTVIASLAQLGYKGITENDFSSLLPKDDWEDELRLCANAEAYWSLSLKVSISDVSKLTFNLTNLTRCSCYRSSSTRFPS